MHKRYMIYLNYNIDTLKGGEGAECEATCVDPDDETPTTVAPPATTPTPPLTTAAPTTGLGSSNQEWIPVTLFHNTLSLPCLSHFLSKSETVKMKK